MMDIDTATVALYLDDVFHGSELVCFNNPGISTRMVSKPLVTPTEPDLVLEGLNSSANYWMFRFDIGLSFKLYTVLRGSGTWNMIKDRMDDQWYHGLDFVKQSTELCVGEQWQKCEDEHFDLRTFCDDSILDVPVIRILAKNDPIVLYKDIRPEYFKYFDKVLVTERGGHCGVHASKETRDEIRKWNDKIVNGAL
eukprot:83670_1